MARRCSILGVRPTRNPDRQLNAPQCALRNSVFDYEGLNALGTISLDKNSCGLAVAPAPDRGPLQHGCVSIEAVSNGNSKQTITRERWLSEQGDHTST